MGFSTPRTGKDCQCFRDGGNSCMLGGIEVGEEDIGVHRLKSRRKGGRGGDWTGIGEMVAISR